MPNVRSRRPSRQLHPLPVPPFWKLWLCQRFEASPQLARDLWRCFAKTASAEQLFLLRQAQRLDGTGPIAALLEAVPPKDLLALTLRLAPEGRPRPLEIRRLEERILHEATSFDGSWL